ncbi:hypothetical protein Mal64_22470 [Pseudobythopirellula maris]|uniref:GYF domain-containing protein n=2 Tax=Pseudobythopirellula maris TaxID=2527991 RepID=A0A5C5ZMV3_9BACT|nr:hypothetical protein Mal64_22470 [Pseudobythopirellula maris]
MGTPQAHAVGPVDPPARWRVRPPTGGEYGPADEATMAGWIAAGRVLNNSLVWRTGWPEWRLAADVADRLPAPLPVGPVAQAPAPPAVESPPPAPTPQTKKPKPSAPMAKPDYELRRRRAARRRRNLSLLLFVVTMALAAVLVVLLNTRS